jgi:hypothetical protein
MDEFDEWLTKRMEGIELMKVSAFKGSAALSMEKKVLTQVQAKYRKLQWEKTKDESRSDGELGDLAGEIFKDEKKTQV